MIKLVINEIPPSNNKYIGRTNRWQYQSDKKRWAWLIKSAVPKLPPKPFEKSIVEINYYFKDKRRRDPDNYSGKFILDGLVSAGVIADDNFGSIKLLLDGYHDKQNPRTEIIITEVKYDTKN